MNQLYPVLTAGGSEVLPTTDGTLYTASMAANPSQNTQVYIEFFSDAAGTIAVTPTAGTVTLEASPMGIDYLTASNGGVINAATVSTPAASYTPPYFVGRMVNGRATFSGVTGAAYARVTFWRY